MARYNPLSGFIELGGGGGTVNVLATTYAGLSPVAGTISASDTVLTAMEKVAAFVNAGGSNAFSIIQTDAGTSPTADTYNDVLTLTSTELDVTGNSTTDTITLAVKNSAVLAKVLTGFSSAAGTIAASDTILQALNKLDGNVGLKLATASFTDAAVTGKLLTGFSSGAGTVSASDTILQALNKLVGNAATYVVGPASATDNCIAVFDGTTGKLIKNSTLLRNANGIASTSAIFGVGISSSTNSHLLFNASSGVNTTNVNAHMIDGSGNTFWLGGAAAAGIWPFARGYFGTGGVVIGTAVAANFAPNYHLDIRQATAATQLYAQFSMVTTTGTTSADGTRIGLDTSANFNIDQQENLAINLKTQGTTRFTVKGSGIINFAAAAIPSYADDAAAGAGGLVTGDLYRIGQTLTIKI